MSVAQPNPADNQLNRLSGKPNAVLIRLILAFFAFFYLAQGSYLIRATSPTTDEVPFHMVNGYAYLKTHDYRMSPANPPFSRQWMALPWLWMNPQLDLDKASWREADSVNFGKEFFYRDNRAIADRLLIASRWMILLFGFALGAVVFVWSRRMYGPWGGILSLALFVLCPNLAAHAAIAHTDMGVALFVTLAAYRLWCFLGSGRRGDLFWFALAYGLACAAKHNALVFAAPFLFIILLRKGFRTAAGALIVTAALSLVVVWASYGFEFKPILGGAVPRIDEKLGYLAAICHAIAPGNAAFEAWARRAALGWPIPMPSYLLGLAGLVRSHHDVYWHYAFGKWSVDGVWYFYIFSFAAKMTLPFLALLALRVVFLKKIGRIFADENIIVLLSSVCLFWATFSDNTGIGVRYLFPVIPMMMVWIGGLTRLAAASRAWTVGLVAVIAFNAATVWSVFPNYLSYFNPVVGGVRGGMEYVRGSDVDWGQGLKALKRYMVERGIDRVSLRYFGTADPTFYGIDSVPVTEAEYDEPLPRVYAFGIFYREHVKWWDRYKPTAIVGGSMLIYDFRDGVKG